MTQGKYLAIFPILPPHEEFLCTIMKSVAEHTKILPPCVKIRPHLTLHSPLIMDQKNALYGAIYDLRQRIHRFELCTRSYLSRFGKHYIVLLAKETEQTRNLTKSINHAFDSLSKTPFEDRNTLHITIASKTTDVFDEIWPKIKEVRVEPLIISVRTIELYEKFDGEKIWNKIDEFPLPA